MSVSVARTSRCTCASSSNTLPRWRISTLRRRISTLRIVGKGDKPAEVPLNPRTHEAIDQALACRTDGPLLLNRWGNRLQRHNAAAIVTRLARRIGIDRRVTPHALRHSYITIGLLQDVPLREMQRAARHTRADTTVAYDQSDRSFHRDPTFVLMTATAR